MQKEVEKLKFYDKLLIRIKELRFKKKKIVEEKYSKYKIGQKFKKKNEDQIYQMIRTDLYYMNATPLLTYTCIFLNKKGTQHQKIMNYFTVYESEVEKGNVVLVD